MPKNPWLGNAHSPHRRSLVQSLPRQSLQRSSRNQVLWSSGDVFQMLLIIERRMEFEFLP